MIDAVLLLTAAGAGLHFDHVQPWRWSEGRRERIPAFSAVLDNRSGEDWAEAHLKVSVHCNGGGERTYPVTLHNLLVGPQAVAETAFDSIGSVEACDGNVDLEVLDARPFDAVHRPTYVVLGFSYDDGSGQLSTSLEGVLDERKRSLEHIDLEEVYWQGQGERFTVPQLPDTAFYCFRVEPGTFGLAGFLLRHDAQATPVARFMRRYTVEPGTASFLGVFRVQREPGRLTSVMLESGEEALEAMPEVKSRPLRRVKPLKP